MAACEWADICVPHASVWSVRLSIHRRAIIGAGEKHPLGVLRVGEPWRRVSEPTGTEISVVATNAQPISLSVMIRGIKLGP